MTVAPLDDTDILSTVAIWETNVMTFERARQDRRNYYRMLRNGSGTGSLTTAKGARDTIAYWREKGWVQE